MMFFSRMHRPATILPVIGDGTTPVYEEVFADGTSKLVETRRDNLYEFVQASKEETLVYNIISRYQRGDINALNQRVGQYMDVVGMPTNLAEAYNTMVDVTNKFNSLPADIKQKFENDVNVFVDVVSHSTPEQLQDYFGVTQQQIDNVNGGDDNNVA